MNKFLNTLILLFIVNFSFTQKCICEKEIDFVINYLENNLPAFKDNVSENTEEKYNLFKSEIKKSSLQDKDDKKACLKLLITYVEFFKDKHTQIYDDDSDVVNLNDSVSKINFLNSEKFVNWERHSLKNKNITPKSIFEIENEYQIVDSSYTVVIIKDRKPWRDFIGVITESKSPLWKNGQVRFELKQKSDSTFDMFYFKQDYSFVFEKDIVFKNGILGNKLYNISLKNRHSFNIETPAYFFKSINDSTNYFQVPTFEGKYSFALKKMYDKYDSIIKTKPFLLLDLRNNGGGDTQNAEPLLKYVYTKPIMNDNIELYITPENILKWEQFYNSAKSDTLNYDIEIIQEWKSEIDKMKKSKNRTFLKRDTNQQIVIDTVLPNPRKVVILMNRNTASSAETFICWAKQSSKVTLIGENSGGYIGYGEITETLTPNFHFRLACTITRFENQRLFEEIGLSPNYYLNNNSDWIEQSIYFLDKF